ncbi:MAG TPA: OmpA family protein [Mycobacterium sp.]|nr:OmpA family protein [Mycobacterium sp.]
MNSGAGLRQSDANADSGGAPEFYRRSLGLHWLIGLVVIPLLIAGIGDGALDRPRSVNGPTGALPTLSPPGKAGGPKLLLASVSIVRNGNNITLTGDLPDDSAKAALMKALNNSLPPGMDIIDEIQLNPNVVALDFFNAGPVFKDSATIANFTLTVNADTIRLTGATESQGQKDAIDSDAKRIWSNLDVVDQLTVNIAPPPPPAWCANLQPALNAMTGGPIAFGNDGFTLTPADEQILTQVADKLKACPSALAALKGYNDNSGNEAMNITLSTQRAQTVADFLTAHGAAGNQIAVKGFGSVGPVAPNDTADGRAKNRRVELAVS